MFKTTTPILSEADTVKFIKQIDLGCKVLDPEFLAEVVQNFQLENLEDSPEFIGDAQKKLFSWREKDGLLVEEVEKFSTRCIACVYGKQVHGYRIHYSIPGPEESRVHYVREIAINYEIHNGQLTDFGWCNAFLSNQDLEELEDECPF